MAHRRSSLLAFLASLVVPGLGQMYNGEVRKGAVLALAGPVMEILLLLSATPVRYGLPGLAATIGLPLVLRLGIAVEAGVGAGRSGRLHRYNRWWWYAGYTAGYALLGYGVVTAATAAIQVFPTRSYYIPSEAMVPTLLVGDYILVEQLGREARTRAGDIVVFRPPHLDGAAKSFVKRVIALPGQEVEIRGGVTRVDGIPLDEPYVAAPAMSDFGRLRIPEGHLFVMGDNRNNSDDSRHWGPLPRENVTGRACYVFWSQMTSRIGLDLRPNP